MQKTKYTLFKASHI